ncbi:hypothetical protein B0H34DRAFT_675323 [Crassisporium funariophilum]|nr:hypothetical protein B0H34DRAFT_675323 [Crassisporium funariophilum]
MATYAIIIKLIPLYAKILSACVKDASVFELFIKESVQNGEIKIKAKEFPLFLYPEGTEYIVGKEFDGLMRGPLLVWVFRCIFSGPCSAFKKESRGNKPSQAEKHGMTSVQPRAIAYAAVQARMVCFSESQTAIGQKIHLPGGTVISDLTMTLKNAKWKAPVDNSDDEDNDPVSRILAQAAVAEDRAASGTSVGGGEVEVEAGDQSGQGPASTVQTPLTQNSLPPPRPAPPSPVPATRAHPPTPPRSLPPPPPPPAVHTHPQPTMSQTQPQPPLATPAKTQNMATATNRPPLQESTGFNLQRKHTELEELSDLSEEDAQQPAKKKPALQGKKKPAQGPKTRGK